MALITLPFDLEKASAGLPEGTYKLMVDEATEVESSSGNPMIKIRWTVVDDPEYNGRTIFDNVVLVESMARRLKSLGDAMGLDFSLGVDADTLPGTTAWAEVVHESYQGEVNARVKRYRAGR